MKGWRPSAVRWLETGSGLVKRANFCRTSDRSACLFPWVLGVFAPWTPWFPSFMRLQLAASWSDKRRLNIRDNKTAPALRLLKEIGGTGNEETTDDETEANPSRPRRAAPKPELGLKNEKCRGDRRKSLKRLNSAKKIEGFKLDFLPLFLDFLPVRLGFPSGKVWISFRAIWKPSSPDESISTAHANLQGTRSAANRNGHRGEQL